MCQLFGTTSSKDEWLQRFLKSVIIEKNIEGHKRFIRSSADYQTHSDGYFAYPNQRLPRNHFKGERPFNPRTRLRLDKSGWTWLRKSSKSLQKILLRFTIFCSCDLSQVVAWGSVWWR